jgi:hypothetical protein
MQKASDCIRLLGREFPTDHDPISVQANAKICHQHDNDIVARHAAVLDIDIAGE